jgi:hypothetical protein
LKSNSSSFNRKKKNSKRKQIIEENVKKIKEKERSPSKVNCSKKAKKSQAFLVKRNTKKKLPKKILRLLNKPAKLILPMFLQKCPYQKILSIRLIRILPKI